MANDVVRISKGLNSLLEEYREAVIASCIHTKDVLLNDPFLSEQDRQYYLDFRENQVDTFKNMSIQDLLFSAVVCAVFYEKKYVQGEQS